MSYIRFAGVDQVPPGACKSQRIGLRRIAVFNINGTFYAIEDACAHMKAPLSVGRLRGTELTCSWHGWVYDLTTGKRKGKEAGCVRTFPVRVEADAILVDPAVNDSFEAGDVGPQGAEDEFPHIA